MRTERREQTSSRRRLDRVEVVGGDAAGEVDDGVPLLDHDSATVAVGEVVVDERRPLGRQRTFDVVRGRIADALQTREPRLGVVLDSQPRTSGARPETTDLSPRVAKGLIGDVDPASPFADRRQQTGVDEGS